MSVKINRSGLDQVIKNAKGLHGRHEVRLVDLMHAEFVSANSRFSDLNKLFVASGFTVESEEDFAAIPDEQWDAFIAENTTFV